MTVGSPPLRSRQFSIASSFEEACSVQREIAGLAEELGFTDKDIFCIKLALEEALVNAIKHGNQFDEARRVHVEYFLGHDRFWTRIRDEGPGFEVHNVPDPTLPENLGRISGRGVMLIQHYMNDVIYHPPGNCVEMTRLRGA